MPDLGEGLADAEIVAWHVAAGDVVALNQTLVEVETEKAVVELPSPFAGTVVELLAAPGETVAVGAPIVTIETAATDGSGDERAEDPSPSQHVPTLVGYGPAEPAASRRPRRRRPAHHDHPGGSTVDPGAAPVPIATSPEGPGTGPGPGILARRPLAAPPVRFTARQEGVDLADVVGNGPGGIITRDDLAAYLGSRTATAARAGTTEIPEHAPLEGTRTPVRGIQKRMAEAMLRSVAEAPQACVFLSVDVSETTALVEHLRASRQFEGVRVTVLGVVAKAVLRALEEHPELNSSWDDSTGEILLKHPSTSASRSRPRPAFWSPTSRRRNVSASETSPTRSVISSNTLVRVGARRRTFGAARSPSPTSVSSASTGESPSSTLARQPSSPSVRSAGRRGSTRARWRCATS